MARIEIRLDEMTMAMEDHAGLISYVLDRETGTVLFLPEDDSFMEEDEELAQRMEENPDQFLGIERISSSESYRIMEDFAETLPVGENERLIEKALSWSRPFSNFKNALSGMGPLRQEWFDFRDERMRR